MKNLKITILSVLILVIGLTVRCKKVTSAKNETFALLKDVSDLKIHRFSITNHREIDVKKLKIIDSIKYKYLYNNEKLEGEYNYLFSKFSITKNRFGLICYNKVRECDADVYYFSLHIIDNRESKKEFIYLTTEDDHGRLYKLSSSFNKDFTVLTTTLNQTSEWVDNETKRDTLFTDVYCINLKSPNLNTVSAIKTFKVIKY